VRTVDRHWNGFGYGSQPEQLVESLVGDARVRVVEHRSVVADVD